MIVNPSFIFLFALLFTSPVQAEIDQRIDTDKKSHFTESEPDNPASTENRNKLEAESLQSASANDKSQAVSPQVDLYVTSWCPYCKKAIAFMHKNNIAFNEYDIEQDLDAAARKESLDPDYSGVPLAVINGTTLRGFSQTKYQKALAKKSN